MMQRWVPLLFLLSGLHAQQLTQAPRGPYRVVDRKLVDAEGRRFLIRGTELPRFETATAAYLTRSGDDFGPYSATALSAIRLRFNLNAVRVPVVDAGPELERLIGRANELELLVVLSGAPAGSFRNHPNVVREEDLAIARRWEPDFADAAACAKLGSDPAVVSREVEEKLKRFDAEQTDWVVSTYEPGGLVDELFGQDATTLENGWKCGFRGAGQAGVGRLIQAHMRGATERGLYVVGAAGGIDVPRGGHAIAYGPAMAGGRSVVVTITDARGVTRPARVIHASAGWGQINFLVPVELARGPARMNVWRADGSRATARLLIADTAPGLWTGVSCAGPAAGESNGSPVSDCKSGRCRSLPVKGQRVRLSGSGFRNARASEIEVTVGGMKARVVSVGASGELGTDAVTIELPASVAGQGETDVICRVRGRIANVVRLRV